jgi:hypothetical protein
MRNILLAATLFGMLPIAAQALPSIGAGDTLNVVGNATFDGVNVLFTTPSNLVAGTGDYAALGTCTSCVVVNTPLEYNPFTNLANLFVATNNGLTATVSLTSQVDPPTVVGNDLALNDDALLTLTGFAPTLGTLEVTINQATGIASGSFSATAQGVSVPEPPAVGLLSLGICGVMLGWRQWRRVW